MWTWIDRRLLLVLNDESLAEDGGAPGSLDERLLDLALARPLSLLAYGDPDAAALAAAYGVGLAKNHASVDGNKRAAFLVVGLFLALNGRRLTASQDDATQTMLAVAAGEIGEEEFAAWIRQNSTRRA